MGIFTDVINRNKQKSEQPDPVEKNKVSEDSQAEEPKATALLENLRLLETETGRFWVDSEGVLRKYENRSAIGRNRPNWEIYSLRIPEGVIILPENAFANRSIYDLSFPDSLRVIENGAFAYSSIGDSVELPRNLQSIGNTAFFGADFSDVKIPDTLDVELIRKCIYLFKYHVICKSLELPKGGYKPYYPPKFFTKKNESGQFIIDSTGTLVNFFPDAQNEISRAEPALDAASDRAEIEELKKADFSRYDGRMLRHLHIPEGVRCIPQYFFRGIFILEELTFPKSLTVIGAGKGFAFADCKLPDVFIGDEVKLGEWAFRCSEIRSLSVPCTFCRVRGEFRSAWIRKLHVRFYNRSVNRSVRPQNSYHGIVYTTKTVGSGNTIRNLSPSRIIRCLSLHSSYIDEVVIDDIDQPPETDA